MTRVALAGATGWAGSALARGIARGLTWAIVVYMAVKMIDLVARGAVGDAFAFTPKALAFWLEITLGLIIPLVLLMQEETLNSSRGLLWSGIFVVVGMIINRLNVAITGIDAAYPVSYVPRWSEVAVSVGIVSLGLIVYREVVARFPILDEHGGANPSSELPRRPAAFQHAGRS